MLYGLKITILIMRGKVSQTFHYLTSVIFSHRLSFVMKIKLHVKFPNTYTCFRRNLP